MWPELNRTLLAEIEESARKAGKTPTKIIELFTPQQITDMCKKENATPSELTRDLSLILKYLAALDEEI